MTYTTTEDAIDKIALISIELNDNIKDAYHKIQDAINKEEERIEYVFRHIKV